MLALHGERVHIRLDYAGLGILLMPWMWALSGELGCIYYIGWHRSIKNSRIIYWFYSVRVPQKQIDNDSL